MKIEPFFDKSTYTMTYIVYDEKTHDAVIIDPVMDYDVASSTYSFESIEQIFNFVKGKKLKIHYILETHAHADHLSGSQELKKRLPGSKVAIGTEITKVQNTFKGIFNFDDDFKTDGSQFDLLIHDTDILSAGTLEFRAIHTPGHTEACYSYIIEDAVFTGDALFMPDFGVARCDFPKGSAETLYNSVTQKLYTLPDETKVFTAHDYQPRGRELKFKSTIGESKESNIHINAKTKKEDFINFRTERDKTLSAPKLLLPSIQINVNAGHLPKPENNKMSYLKIPVRYKDV